MRGDRILFGVLRVLLVDDHPLLRRGVAGLLRAELGDVHIAEAGDVAEALRLVQAEAFDLAIIDVSLPGRGGLDLLEQLRVIRPGTPVLVLSAHPEQQFAERALRLGACGYVTKHTAAEELVGAVRRVLRGGRYVSAALAEHMAAQLAAGGSEAPHQRLSAREFDVFLRLARGQAVKQVAAELRLSVKTVSTYRSRLLDKLGASNNAALTLYAVQHELVVPGDGSGV